MRYLPFTVLPLLLVATGCTDRQDLVGIPDGEQLSVQAASATISFPIFNQFDRVNPCTDLNHTITMTGTGWYQPHNNNEVIRLQRVFTTSDGFEGRGTLTQLGAFESGIFRGAINDMLTHSSGARIRLHGVLVIDYQPPPLRVRVDRLTLTCVRP